MKKLGVPLHRGDYDQKLWNDRTLGMDAEPEGGNRCTVCFRMRLEKTAELARKMSFHSFATTLTISPHKNCKMIFNIGKDIGSKYGVEFLDVDFKKRHGFQKSVEISKRLGLYRQDYCGCIYSLRDRLRVKERRLTELYQEIRECRRCDLPQSQKVLPSGGIESRVMVIGQAPGKRELVTCLPFSGPAGARFFEWFAGFGITETNLRRIAYITATVKCYPGHVAGRMIDKAPSSSQVRNCFSFLEKELKILRPRLLVPIGKLAIARIIGERKLSEAVGKKFREDVLGHLCTVVPLPHPSGANPWNFRNPDLLRQALSLLREEIAGGKSKSTVRAKRAHP